jgi:hypothetical protein
MLKEPEKIEKFLTTLEGIRYRGTPIFDNNNTDIGADEPTKEVFLNILPDLPYIMDQITSIYESERRKPFKMTFRFGFVIETAPKITYEVINPFYNENHQMMTLTIQDRKSLNDFTYTFIRLMLISGKALHRNASVFAISCLIESI